MHTILSRFHYTLSYYKTAFKKFLCCKKKARNANYPMGADSIDLIRSNMYTKCTVITKCGAAVAFVLQKDLQSTLLQVAASDFLCCKDAADRALLIGSICCTDLLQSYLLQKLFNV